MRTKGDNSDLLVDIELIRSYWLSIGVPGHCFQWRLMHDFWAYCNCHLVPQLVFISRSTVAGCCNSADLHIFYSKLETEEILRSTNLPLWNLFLTCFSRFLISFQVILRSLASNLGIKKVKISFHMQFKEHICLSYLGLSFMLSMTHE